MNDGRPWWWWIVALTERMDVLAARLERRAAANRARSEAKAAAALREVGYTEAEVEGWLEDKALEDNRRRRR